MRRWGAADRAGHVVGRPWQVGVDELVEHLAVADQRRAEVRRDDVGDH
ncbi:MAG: hypothetical protein M3R63_16095 [Actinomycetota bacterium]|nr:hypothetical protein [Actinomycetota bacterium]